MKVPKIIAEIGCNHKGDRGLRLKCTMMRC